MNRKGFACLFLSLCLCLQGASTVPDTQQGQRRPNILFIIMDDIGIDQLRAFGYGGLTAPRTPVLDAVAHEGVRFRNVWSMPECSPSRAMFFEGRYPLRTNIYNAILSTDLANSQVSPYETTTPKILREVNYTSALIGKFHLAGPTNYPFTDAGPNSLGFDYFHGFLEGAPHPIDTTAGGAKTEEPGGNGTLPKGPYSCGFVPNKQTDNENGADYGACYFANGGCKLMSQTPTIPTPGRSCLEQGGIFDPNATACEAKPPANLNFGLSNGYYVWNLVENDLKTNTATQFPLTDPRARTYSPTEETTTAINWIKKQGDKPWMATVSYSSIHAPYQQAPQRLTPGEPDLSGVSCDGNTADTRKLSNQMVEALDTEIGRLLVGTGLAQRDEAGVLRYDPDRSNTMVIIIGDNGTYAPSVKAPFDITHAKGYVYQTGVWVPLIVAGPLVNSPDRNVESMVNVADLFQLFGEIAGVDVRKYVPAARKLDAVPMLAYLTNPAQPSLREYNFTQAASNISAVERPAPCVIRIPQTSPTGEYLVNTCVQIFPNQALCQQEQGEWYGPANGQAGYTSCCALLNSHTAGTFDLLPLTQAAVRNDQFKLIQLVNENCDQNATSQTDTTYGLYRINQAVPVPKIDFPATNLIKDESDPTNGLTPEETTAFLTLKTRLEGILNSEPACPGDGNTDGVVDSTDIQNWQFFNGKGSSWYDFPTFNPSLGMDAYDGQTNNGDLNVIMNNLGRTCRPR